MDKLAWVRLPVVPGAPWLARRVRRGRAVGAYFDDEAARPIAVDPARQWVLHLVALGVPA